MATIQLKRSAVPAKVPTTTDLSLGEIAINTYDGKLYIKRSAGSDSIVEFMRADFSNANSLGTGIICGAGGSPQYRSLASGDAAITVTNANGTSGNPTVIFQPGNVAIGNLAGTLSLNKGGTGATTQNGAANAILPSQASNSGKFLTTNGTDTSWATVSASPAGSTGQVQYNNAGSLAGASNVVISPAGDLTLSESTSPTAANATHTVLLRRSELPYPSIATNAIQNGNVTELYMQPHLGSRDIAWWNPPGNATTVPGVLGIAAMTAGGTVTVRTVATTNIATRARRLGYVSANSVGATCGQYQAQRQWTTAGGSGAGGFYCVYRFTISDSSLVPQARMFVGMSNENGAFGNTQQFPMYNYIGVGHDNGESNFKFIYTGSALAPAWSSLNSNFPVAVNTLYELRIYSYTNTVLHMELANLTNGQTATIAITNTTHFPSSTTLLAPRAWRTNNSVSTAVGIDIASLYIEKPY